MATSGSVDFNLNRNQIINIAYGLLEMYEPGETISGEDQSFAENMLNMMVKDWQGKGVHLWNRREATLFTALSTAQYALGPSGTHATNSYVSTTLSNAALAAATTISVTSSTGMTIGDNIGIKLTSGARQWTTISNIASTTITLANALTGAAASGNTVVTYTTKMNRPIEIVQARRFDLVNSTDVEIDLVSHDVYQSIPNKTSSSDTTLVYFDKQLTNSQLYVWPVPSDVDHIIKFTYYDSVEDFDASTDNPDFPQEWLLTLSYNLAVWLAHPCGKATKLQSLKPMADELYIKASIWDTDSTPITFAPTNN
jgi:hypothetical protein